MLKKLREIEREAGVDVRIKNDLERGDATTEGSDEDHQEEGSGDRQRIQRRKRMNRRHGDQTFAVFVGRFPKFLRASDFKLKVKESCDPIQVVWRGRNGYAFLVFDSQEKCDTALEMLQGLAFNGKQVKVRPITCHVKNVYKGGILVTEFYIETKRFLYLHFFEKKI